MYPRITAHTLWYKAPHRCPPLFQDAWLVKPPTMDWGKSNLYLPHIQQTPTPSKRIHYGAPHTFHNPSTLLVLHAYGGRSEAPTVMDVTSGDARTDGGRLY
ncbi:unnamed protein product [Microthlaspi erraticum]|uniref:Uncharacterized protein n=1 Tax=Microthlaspi erraticum TaxID=1685480 RepID=A0A6D2HV87_9BRAS|nr:unnamed protein product [Microthlaspi erraticum]